MKILKEIVKIICVLAGAVFLGTALLIFVYALPTGRIKANVAKSSNIFDVEGTYPALIPGFQFAQLDNFTDSIMLGIAMYNGEESVSEKAMSNYRMRSDELGIVKSTTHYANDVEADYYRKGYQRYWHGYLIFLKPLLAFFTYGEIRLLNGMFQIAMSALAIKMMLKSRLKIYLPAYIAAFLFLNPATVSLSLQYSAIYNIMLVFIVLWLSLLERRRLLAEYVPFIFLAAGCITSYIDFLTYPIAVVGILAILSINTWGSSRENVLRLFKNIIYWGIGYVGMWAGKWLAGSLILKQNLFKDALWKLMFYSSADGESSRRIEAIIKNIEVYNNKVYIGLLVLLVIYVIGSFVKNRIKVNKEHLREAGIYGIISFMPLVWMLFASNHSEEHAWFVHRGLCVTVLALGCIYVYIRENCNIDCRK